MILEPKYTIERYEHGWLVRGAVPVDDLVWIFKLVPGNAIADALVAEAVGATMALTTRNESKAWRAALGLVSVRENSA